MWKDQIRKVLKISDHVDNFFMDCALSCFNMPKHFESVYNWILEKLRCEDVKNIRYQKFQTSQIWSKYFWMVPLYLQYITIFRLSILIIFQFHHRNIDSSKCPNIPIDDLRKTILFFWSFLDIIIFKIPAWGFCCVIDI